MDWTDWMGKRIFVRLKTGKVFSGKVVDVSAGDPKAPIFIKIIDKFNEPVVFIVSDITEIKLDGERKE